MLLALLAASPFAARVQFDYNGTSYPTLRAAFDAIGTAAGTYTINVTGNGNIGEQCQVRTGQTIHLTGTNGTPTVSRSANQGTSGDIYVDAGGTLHVSNLVLDGGGATYQASYYLVQTNGNSINPSFLHLSSTTVQNCHLQGSAIRLFNAEATIVNCTIQNNTVNSGENNIALGAGIDA